MLQQWRDKKADPLLPYRVVHSTKFLPKWHLWLWPYLRITWQDPPNLLGLCWLPCMALSKNHCQILCGTVDSLALCLDSKQVQLFQHGTARVLSLLQYVSAVFILVGLHLQHFVSVHLTRILEKIEYENIYLYIFQIYSMQNRRWWSLCDLRVGCCVFLQHIWWKMARTYLLLCMEYIWKIYQ